MAFDFNIQESGKLKGVYIIKPNISTDNRGNIWTSFYSDDIDKLLPNDLKFKHDKFSKSIKNVLRGIHGDTKSYKLVTCVYGEIMQVVVDLRVDSSTYMQWESFIINENNQQSILIPPYMGNAYYVMSDEVIYHYKLAYKGEYFDADQQFTYSWNDDKIGIKWPTTTPILSSRDIKG